MYHTVRLFPGEVSDGRRLYHEDPRCLEGHDEHIGSPCRREHRCHRAQAVGRLQLRPPATRSV